MIGFALLKADLPASVKVFTHASVPTPVICAYAACTVAILTMYHTVGEEDYTSILTMSAIVQCLGVSLLWIQVHTSGCVDGISTSAIKLDALAVALRLSSTLWLHGYLPTDLSGEYIYQATDVVSLVILLLLLRRISVIRDSIYNGPGDAFRIGPMVITCLVLAAVFHADMDEFPLFDTLWMTGLFCGVVSVLPQFWLIVAEGRTPSMMGHYIAALAVSRVMSGCFMWMARFDISCEYWIQDIEHATFAILLAHAIHLLLLCDFGYYYATAMASSGMRVGTDMQLPQFI
jgi:ER lumen protein retaining receptor